MAIRHCLWFNKMISKSIHNWFFCWKDSYEAPVQPEIFFTFEFWKGFHIAWACFSLTFMYIDHQICRWSSDFHVINQQFIRGFTSSLIEKVCFHLNLPIFKLRFKIHSLKIQRFRDVIRGVSSKEIYTSQEKYFWQSLTVNERVLRIKDFSIHILENSLHLNYFKR